MQLTRTLSTLAIVAFWLTMMGLLVWRQRGSSPLPTAQLVDMQLTAPRDTRMGVFFGAEQVGALHLQATPERRHQRQGMLLKVDATMALTLFDRSTDFTLNGSVWRPVEGEEAELAFDVRSGGYDLGVEGRVEDDALQAVVRTAGERYPLNIPIDGRLVFSSGFGLALQVPQLAVGEAVQLESFDPMTLRASPTLVRCIAQETITVAGRAIPTRRLQVTTGGLRAQVWIDEAGEVVRAQTPFGLTLELIDPQAPHAAAPSTENEALLTVTAITPSGLRPFRGARIMEVQITGVDDLALPEDTTQTRLNAGRYRVALPHIPTSGVVEPIDDPALLAADAFVQADHPRIRAQMEAIVGTEKEPWEQARRIHDWVFSEITKEAAISIPSALEVLTQRRGDCNEHTVLFTALARAAGLPSRIAIGLVWSEAHEGFYYHAWPEVHVGQWVGMDPTLGQPQADATHIKLLNGGIEQWPQLLSFLGRLEIEVAEIR